MTQFLCVTISFKQTSADLVHPVRVALSGYCEKRTEEQERIGIEKVENKAIVEAIIAGLTAEPIPEIVEPVKRLAEAVIKKVGAEDGK